MQLINQALLIDLTTNSDYKKEAYYYYSIEHNPDTNGRQGTKDYDLTVSNIDSVVGTYSYTTQNDAEQDMEMLCLNGWNFEAE